MLLEEKRTCLQGNHISSRLYKSILIIVGPSPRAAGQEPKRGGVSGLHLEPRAEERTLATARSALLSRSRKAASGCGSRSFCASSRFHGFVALPATRTGNARPVE